MRTARRPAGLLVALLAASLVVAAPIGAVVGPRSTSRLPYPLPAPAVQPEPCPPPKLPPGPPGQPLGPPIVAESAIPVVGPPAARQVSLKPLEGKGIWVTVFPGDTVNASSIVATAASAHLQQIFIRTGSTHDGFYGGSFLPALVADAHAAGISVDAWDFPTMSSPRVDAARAKKAFDDGVDAFSPDIESASEGTYLTARRVAYYLSLVRGFAGNRPVMTAVMPPTTYWLAHYPYAAEAPYVDAFAPLVYWSCTEPSVAVAAAIAGLSHLHVPVAPVGQDYDMASEGGRHGLPAGGEIWSFLDVARREGAIGASLYDLEAGGPTQLTVLSEYPWAHALADEARS